MIITPINGNNQPTFGYKNILKTLYKKGKLPVKYGFYGDELNKKNVTLEHLKPISKGGKTELSNLVLASANKNQERAARPLSEMLKWDCVGKYLEQFHNVKRKDFDGNTYIQMVLRTIKEILKGENV